MLTDVAPATCRKPFDRAIVEEYRAAVVATLTIKEATKRRFSRTRLGLNKVASASFETKFRMPYVGPETLARCKNLRYNIV